MENTIALLKTFFRAYSVDLLRYIIFAGGAYLIFYVWKRERFQSVKIQSKFADRKNMLREVQYSLLTFFIFSIGGVSVAKLVKHGHTLIYKDIHAHTWAYFAFSVVAAIVLHDAYFYWTHRFMHWNKIYKYVHRIHHLSTNPTPWAAFAFHPLEAVVEFGILPLLVFIIPMHPLAILAWVIYMTLLNVMGHLGFEILPSGFTQNKTTAWHNTSVHHNMHHRYVRCNYGLYFNMWDQWMNTNHNRYHTEFEKVTEKENTTEGYAPQTQVAAAEV